MEILLLSKKIVNKSELRIKIVKIFPLFHDEAKACFFRIWPLAQEFVKQG
ncbi:MAG: hypothetical protein QE271_14090 [Bacteriovoracaceae bacterium]|nr:hypothetical protein [Bacteriovoracaceae bacterium]